ncbi:MAG: hypothetical protein ACTFAK_05340 [Candidatus Electronema sp. VV]
MKTTATVLTNGLIGLAAFFATSIPLAAQASLQVSYEGPDQEKDCHVMLAGQHIEAGQVCLEVSGENLLVTYEMQDGWELIEAHLWAGLTLASMPQSKTGNPKIGNFPYKAEGITGADSHTFTVPLTVFGGVEPCDVTGLLAAHAAVRKANGDGTYQTETGWLEGPQIIAKGSWAMNSSIFFTCPADPEIAPVTEGCETAFAYGDRNGDRILDRDKGDRELDDFLKTERWGWQLAVQKGDNLNVPIYAAAGNNDINNGTLVGHLNVGYVNTTVSVSYEMLPGFTTDETHLYVGDVYLPKVSPGTYGHIGTGSSYTVPVSGAETVYVVAHAVARGAELDGQCGE